jgi:hypothetical protein
MKKNQNILKYAEKNARKGKSLAVGSLGMKVTKIIYILAALYSIFMCVVVMFGNLFTMMEYKEKTTANMVAAYNEQRMYFFTLCIAVAATIVALILMRLKKAIPLGAVGCLNCVIVFTVFFKASLQNDIKNGGQMGFWGPFGIPSIFCAAMALFIMALYLIDNRNVNAEYNSITDRLYERATDGGSVSIDYDEFDKVLDDYRGEEIFLNDKPLKKSQRRRKEKQEELLAELKAAEEKESDEV